MKTYLKIGRIERGTFSSERWVTVPARGGDREHMVDERSIKDGMIEAWIVDTEGDWRLVDLPYCLDPLRCWVHASSLVHQIKAPV